MKEYRAAFRLNDRAPRGAGMTYGPIEPLSAVTRRLYSALDEMKRKPDTAGYDGAWAEEREVSEWEPLA